MDEAKSYISIIDRVKDNLKLSRYELTDGEKKKIYTLVSKAFEKVPEIPLKSDPETLYNILKDFKECCNKFYGKIGADYISKTGTNMLIDGEIGKIKTFVNSGSYEEPNYKSVFETIFIFIAAEIYKYYRDLKKK